MILNQITLRQETFTGMVTKNAELEWEEVDSNFIYLRNLIGTLSDGSVVVGTRAEILALAGSYTQGGLYYAIDVFQGVMMRAVDQNTMDTTCTGMFFNCDFLNEGNYGATFGFTGVAPTTNKRIYQSGDTYDEGDIVISQETSTGLWRHYQNITGNNGGSQPSTDATNWQDLPLEDGYGYILKADTIAYDIVLNEVIGSGRKDEHYDVRIENHGGGDSFLKYCWGNDQITLLNWKGNIHTFACRSNDVAAFDIKAQSDAKWGIIEGAYTTFNLEMGNSCNNTGSSGEQTDVKLGDNVNNSGSTGTQISTVIDNGSDNQNNTGDQLFCVIINDSKNYNNSGVQTYVRVDNHSTNQGNSDAQIKVTVDHESDNKNNSGEQTDVRVDWTSNNSGNTGTQLEVTVEKDAYNYANTGSQTHVTVRQNSQNQRNTDDQIKLNILDSSINYDNAGLQEVITMVASNNSGNGSLQQSLQLIGSLNQNNTGSQTAITLQNSLNQNNSASQQALYASGSDNQNNSGQQLYLSLNVRPNANNSSTQWFKVMNALTAYPEYASRAAAISGGVAVNDFYLDSTTKAVTQVTP